LRIVYVEHLLKRVNQVLLKELNKYYFMVTTVRRLP